MKNVFLKMMLCCLAAVLLCLPIVGYETENGYKPSLYHNDEAWYKDTMAPLLVKDGVYHIPADILEMFSGITVQIYTENNNLLIHNTNTDVYASVLYSTATAAVNGEIAEKVDIFRQQGYYYIDAEWIADICGLECTFKEDAHGNMLLRLTNGEQRRSFDELIDDYTNSAEPEEAETKPIETPPPESDGTKKIYLVCTNAPGAQQTPADLIEGYGLVCTEFLTENTGTAEIVQKAVVTRCGVFAEDGTVEAADGVNAMVETLLCRKLPLALLPEGGDTVPFTETGYIPVVPDFTVNYQTDPDVVFENMLTYLRNSDHVVLRVGTDGCSQRILVLLIELLGWNEDYSVVKLTEWE
ncbi:MAG: hypothetical protein IJ325_10220 [Clostridia bacterium]|nr:hypothetical protein [Clostridia bacterium]